MTKSFELKKKNKVSSLGFLRGLAVLMVCFCHFGAPLTNNNTFSKVFKIFEEYGVYGVHIFFVISGFIIPLSMDKAKYNITFYLNFLYKRALRLHPPYLVALLLTLIIVFAADFVKQIPFSETPAQITKSMIYLNITPNNPVFWTLKVEAEYYVFMGFFFVLVKRYPTLTILFSLPLFVLLSQTDLVKYLDLLDYLTFFLVGILGYLIYTNRGSKIIIQRALIALLLAIFYFYGLAPLVSVLFTITVILYYKGKVHKVFDFLGEISYSIYLIHFPIGIKLINLALVYIQPSLYWVLFIITNVVVLLAAYLFWKYIEKPAGKFSNRIKYGEPKPDIKVQMAT